MNFLGLRSTQTAAPVKQLPPPPPPPQGGQNLPPRSVTLECLISKDPYLDTRSTPSSDHPAEDHSAFDIGHPSFDNSSNAHTVNTHLDVSEDQGWITIPYSNFRLPFSLNCLVLLQ